MSLGGNQQLQELAQAVQAIEQEQEMLRSEIEALQRQKTEIDEATEGIETLETGSTVQVPLGGGAFVRAAVENSDEVIVDLGADYAAERDADGALSTLETKKEMLDDRIQDIRSEIAELDDEADELEAHAQQLQQQQLQQMQQQQQQQDLPDE